MSEIFFTSDTHFNHNQGFIYAARGFTSPIEMGEAIVDTWNDKVKSEDTVYHLGDFIFGAVGTLEFNSALGLIKQLHGTIYWILGNHDSVKKLNTILQECENIECLMWAQLFEYGRYKFYLSHYPTLTANFDDKHFSQHVIALHGHTHQQRNFMFPDNPFVYHVGVDSHNCAPVHIEEILADVRNRYNELGTQTSTLFTKLQ